VVCAPSLEATEAAGVAAAVAATDLVRMPPFRTRGSVAPGEDGPQICRFCARSSRPPFGEAFAG